MIVPTVDEDEEQTDVKDRLAGLEGAPSRRRENLITIQDEVVN